MENKTVITEAKFAIGARVKHSLLEYRGLVLDVDPQFFHKEALSQEVLNNLPNKSQPWYHVLVHGSQHVTYVAEQNLLADYSEEDFDHPVMEMLFTRTEAGLYQRRQQLQ